MTQKNKRKVVASAAEARLAKKAEAMKEAGFKSFEGTYGSKEANSFNMGADIAAMEGVGMMTNNNTAKASVPQPEVPVIDDTATIPSEAQAVPNPTPEIQLSEDPEKRLEQTVEALKKISANPPTVETLKSWKQMHGDIFLLNIEDHVFIYRYLKRQEWIQINANPRLEEMKEHQMEEMMFEKCTLWPQMDALTKAGSPAGAMSMVVQQIRLQSLFLDPAYVAQMTFKL